MKYIFGPVNSRRLGRSLGIDLFQNKVCNLNCIYCEVGSTDLLTNRRDAYVPLDEIKQEIAAYCKGAQGLEDVDVVTLTASGEPTLHADFGEILQYVKTVTNKPVAVITNGTTLVEDAVRNELQLADIVIPSLDAALPEVFRKIDRPETSLDLKAICDGLIEFSNDYAGRLWLEILLVKGINDGTEHLEALCAIIRKMKLERVQLNTVDRPPLEAFARPVEHGRLEEIGVMFRECLQLPVDLLVTAGNGSKGKEYADEINNDETLDTLEKILHMLKRRPCTAVDIDRVFHRGGPDKVEQLLMPLVHSGVLRVQTHDDRQYYQKA